jgi:hypothetical protein
MVGFGKVSIKLPVSGRSSLGSHEEYDQIDAETV